MSAFPGPNVTSGNKPEAPEQEVRAAWLTRRNAERWFGPAARSYSTVRLERGFLYVWATARELLDHPPTDLPEDIRAWLETLYLGGPDGRQELLTSPVLGCFTRLDLPGSMRSEP